MQYRSNKVALRSTCIRNIKFKISKVGIGCQYVGYLYYIRKPKLGYTKPLTGPHAAYRLDICFRPVIPNQGAVAI